MTNLIPVLLFTTNALALVLVSFLLSKVGRKPLLQFGKVITIVALIMVTVGFFLNSDAGNILVVVGLFIWMISTGLSIFSIIILYIAEIV